MVRCAGKLGKHKCHSASTAPVSMGAAEKYAHCCAKLGTTKCSRKTQKELENGILQKYDKFVKSAFGVLCSPEVKTMMATVWFIAVALHHRSLDRSEWMYFRNECHTFIPCNPSSYLFVILDVDPCLQFVVFRQARQRWPTPC